jgi:hypothetical protein
LATQPRRSDSGDLQRQKGRGGGIPRTALARVDVRGHYINWEGVADKEVEEKRPTWQIYQWQQVMDTPIEIQQI